MASSHYVPAASARFNCDEIVVQDLQKPQGSILTGVGYLDHMIDQFNSHAQIGVSLQIEELDGSTNDAFDRNRHSKDQAKLLSLVGSKLGTEFKKLLEASPTTGTLSSFSCPLDEALVTCVLERTPDAGRLNSYTLEPFGKYPAAGRQYIGKLETARLRYFWTALAEHAGLSVSLRKIRGDNAHHICESSFKAFSRALRNMLDGVNTDCEDSEQCMALYGPISENWNQGVTLGRQGSVKRQTKETAIEATVRLDGGASGVIVSTGISLLDLFLTAMAEAACMSLTVTCRGDLWIDDHHTAEDVAIAVGQVLTQALGTKAGLVRMWSANAECGDTKVQVTMDLSNRPCLTHNLMLDNGQEMVDDLSLEMFEHVLDSLVVNARMTVHMVQMHPNENVQDTVQAVAVAFGRALRYCAMVDQRRSGATASSKGTLSV